jgi:hypothetical protein
LAAFFDSGQDVAPYGASTHDFEESAAGAPGIVVADGRRDLVDGRSRKL